ncbi:unnamed protein product [Bemisia tabaci]|uniref:RRM domain-containing protein n=2 Tax=Bemisia tabaci TaxID=7038 RepID=A0A9P0FYE8_BEMTA|nr:unnamed protein product [Bemisia tabaci]
MSFNDDCLSKRQRVDYKQGQASEDSEFYPGGDGRRKRPAPENHVLLLTVFTPAYPITTDVLHTICHPHGKVHRIVVFKKNGVQAMVEFDSIESAKRAKEALDGADIYSGCCTLKIEFAKPTKLNVYKNDMDSWDYTEPPRGTTNTVPSRGPLLQEPPHFGARPTPFRGAPGGPGELASPAIPARSRIFSEFIDYNDGFNEYELSENSRSFGILGRGDRLRSPTSRDDILPSRSPAALPAGPFSPPNGAPTQSGVVMVYGLNQKKVNCDKLFNLFCLYGNVGKIKFLKSKEGCAMIQMSDAVAVERCIRNLHNVNLHGREMQLGHSKQIYLSDVQYPFNLPDGTPSFKKYLNSSNNRFLNPAMAAKNRITPPSKILHFFNTPVTMDSERIAQLIQEKDVNPPVKAVMISPKGDRSSSGHMEFANIPDAVNALMCCNHMPIRSEDSNFPFTLKLCFSSSKSVNLNKKNFNKEVNFE